MQIVLLKKVKTLGSPGDVLEVKRGHAVNFLIPEGIALPATKGFIKEAKIRTKKLAMSTEVDKAKLSGFIKEIDGLEIEFKEKASEKGSLFGSIKKGDIASKIAIKTGKSIDEDLIKLSDPIKKIGEYEVVVSDGGLAGTLKIKVELE